MRKFGVFTSFIFIAIVLAGIYGILHDQITYSISPEYFTKFKYRQFGFEPEWFGGHRKTVAAIGFLATWWTGLFIAIPLGLISLFFPDHNTMGDVLKKAIGIVMLITIASGIVGFMYGRFYLNKSDVDWWLPADLSDKSTFIIVGSIHNFSYLGGLLGLLISIVYMIRAMFQLKAKQNSSTTK
jgi:predicted secreted protein